MSKPRILIAVDIEGVANVWRPEQTQAGHAEYEHARRWMTAEANAAIKGAFSGGAAEVWVNDSHGHFANLLPHELDSRAQLIQGKPRLLGMMQGVDGDGTGPMDGVILVGWHAKSKTQGVLAHTTNSFAFARVWLGDQEVGEIGIYAALAGEHGVPVLMVSGCDVTAAETEALLPEVRTTVVKWSHGARSGRALLPAAAQALIQNDAQGVLQRWRAGHVPAPLRLATPTVLRIQAQNPALADVFSLWPSVQRASGDTVAVDCASVADAVRCMNALSAMSSVLR